MADIGKYSSLDVGLLREQVAFEYLQLFEQSVDGTSYREYPVPAEVKTPEDGRFGAVKVRAIMRLASTIPPAITLLPRRQLLEDWDFDVVAATIPIEGAVVLLLFYSHILPESPPDLEQLSRAVKGKRN